VPTLRARLEDDAVALRAAYLSNATGAAGGGVVPAAEWLLDNDHVIVAQIDEVRADLPAGYYRQLPKLADGPLAGYPRVLGLVWAYVAHTDSRLDVDHLRRFVAAYQRVQPLTIGELWAIAITLRFVLDRERAARRGPDRRRPLRIDGSGSARRAHPDAGRAPGLAGVRPRHRSGRGLDVGLRDAARDRLRDQDPLTTPALGWLEDALQERGTSIAAVVEATQQRLGAANVTVRNAVTSMRRITDIDWADLFESVSLVDARLREGSAFDAMDFATRDRYRGAVETLARASGTPELDVVTRALEAARTAAADAPDAVEAARVGDPGYVLIGAGRRAFERRLRAPPTLRTRVARLVQRGGLGGYVGTIVGVTALLVALFVVAASAAGLSAAWCAVLAALLVVPLSETATALVHRARRRPRAQPRPPRSRPRVRRTERAPDAGRGADRVRERARRRGERRAARGPSPLRRAGDLTFALLSDVPDADSGGRGGRRARDPGGPGGDRPPQPAARPRPVRTALPAPPPAPRARARRGRVDGLGAQARQAARALPAVARRGRHDVHARRRPSAVRAGRGPLRHHARRRHAAPARERRRLIGKMAHPLNRPRFDPTARRVVEGHAVLQPRLSATLPMPGEGSVYQRVFGVAGGIDPYASAASDVYQDLFGEGSYTGKGIFDVDAFEASLAGRVPERTLLSHDLFEGVFARAGLASDVELIETSPARYDVAVKRQQRWVRGDWQLLPWITGHERGQRRRRRPSVAGRWPTTCGVRWSPHRRGRPSSSRGSCPGRRAASGSRRSSSAPSSRRSSA
jgi:cyclic beta-1,2-glucan synthetase